MTALFISGTAIASASTLSSQELPSVKWENNKPEITTEQCILRPIKQEDLENYIQLFKDPLVMKFYLNGQPKSAEDTAKRFNSWLGRWKIHNFSALAIVDRKTQEFIGHAVLGHGDYEGDIENGWSEFAYVLSTPYWNAAHADPKNNIGTKGKKGIGTEVAQAVVTYAKEMFKLGVPVPLDLTDKEEDQAQAQNLISLGKVTLKGEPVDGKYPWIGGRFVRLVSKVNKDNIASQKILDKVFVTENGATKEQHPTDSQRFIYTVDLATARK